MVLTYFITPIILFICGLAIGTGKANFLIAGYNTASKEEKAKINEKALSKFMCEFLLVLGLIQLIIPIANIIEVNNFDFIFTCTNIAFIAVTLLGIIFMNTGKRFKK